MLIDQILIENGQTVSTVASLDTSFGKSALRVEGKALKNVTAVGSHAIVGGLVGKAEPLQK
ncbi:hypothetical protein BVX98_07305 [bacterium F11]|nr:hypothetical protein BVX98_07305 [bacterium F11]